MIFLPSYSYYFLKVEIKKPDEDEGLVLKRNEERCLFATVFNEPWFYNTGCCENENC